MNAKTNGTQETRGIEIPINIKAIMIKLVVSIVLREAVQKKILKGQYIWSVGIEGCMDSKSQPTTDSS